MTNARYIQCWVLCSCAYKDGKRQRDRLKQEKRNTWCHSMVAKSKLNLDQKPQVDIKLSSNIPFNWNYTIVMRALQLVPMPLYLLIHIKSHRIARQCTAWVCMCLVFCHSIRIHSWWNGSFSLSLPSLTVFVYVLRLLFLFAYLFVCSFARWFIHAPFKLKLNSFSFKYFLSRWMELIF